MRKKDLKWGRIYTVPHASGTVGYFPMRSFVVLTDGLG